MSMNKTWWGEEFVGALETFIDSGRLQRGRAYRSDHRTLAFNIHGSCIDAKIRGNVNPYFGVTKEPKYNVHLEFKTISNKDWQPIINKIAQNPAWLSKLMLNEIPKDIEKAFGKHHFLPASFKDIKASCSCPDYANPCKHIAGVYYRIAEMLDAHPMLLFPLRGIQADELHEALTATELGRAFVEHLSTPETIELEIEPTQFKAIETQQKNPSYQQFWSMNETSSQINYEEEPPSEIAASLVKKQGDYPAFWDKPRSFIGTMEQIYSCTRTKNKKHLL
ncbi:SWIM zinc finger family protein [Piscirickettsia litoralis]|uniref:SWIM-type domain-containing protein n=1 Tax=Piscirickettsia litoralis TaxID=1891921 RepID=A0ABX2ZZ25_9GAMM|nr:SWIM zinc finger family protein [Piscirickettsia litoralis]ODN41272.1 hypothetical protein BGC07_17030 [Piscirickettsia litoralis]